MLKFYIIIII